MTSKSGIASPHPSCKTSTKTENMTIRIFLVVALFLASLPMPCIAGGRDTKVDLLAISARFVALSSTTPRKAGDPEEQFIEDVVVPAVHDVVTRSSGQLSNVQMEAVIDFFIASEPSANEEVSEIAMDLYRMQKTGFCASIAKRDPKKQAIVLDRIKGGLGLAGKPIPRNICPQP
jgi:hypothetical protein